MNRTSRSSTRFLAEAFAVWCDQKSRLTGARAMGLLDDESHDALAEAYTRTRELIGALLARADAHHVVPRAAGVADGGGQAAGPGGRAAGEAPAEPPRAGNCPAC